MLGGNRRPDEQTTIMEIAALKNLARYRVEERFSALGLPMVDQQRDVVALDLRPAGIVDPCAAEVQLQPGDGLGNTAVVEVDAVARDVSDRQPVGRLEIALRQPRAVPEQLVMAVESVEGRLGNGLRASGGARAVNSSRPRPGP